MLFAMYLALYSVGRFLVTFLREDRIWAVGLQEAHFIAILVLVITVPVLAFRARIGSSEDVIEEFAQLAPRGSRAERRRRDN